MSKDCKFRFNHNDGVPNFRAEDKQLSLIFTSHALLTAENKQIRIPMGCHIMTDGQPTAGGLKPREIKRQFKMVLEHKVHCPKCNSVIKDYKSWGPEQFCKECGASLSTFEFKRNDGKVIPSYFKPIPPNNSVKERATELKEMGINAHNYCGGGECSYDWWETVYGYIESQYSKIDLKEEDEWCALQIQEEDSDRYEELEFEAAELISEYEYLTSMVCEEYFSDDGVELTEYDWEYWEIDKVNLSRTLLLRWNTEDNKVDGKLVSGEFVLKHGGDFYKYVILFKSHITEEEYNKLHPLQSTEIRPIHKAILRKWPNRIEEAEQFREVILNRIKTTAQNMPQGCEFDGLRNMNGLDLEKMEMAHDSDDMFLVLSVSKIDKRKLRKMGFNDSVLNRLGM